ncbi:tryptophan synthase subunit beta [candidate division CPR3 bacterium GWF2_35_18]|uniref:Tryptophan synthase beta chain n=1 Tax=candidate division CPR3 bacterium GW2011_GWF2_35_18 TaxID=1618350 RepID=A0A0G0BJH7_UNCC3|nr:MAG: Tryptophan synthase beta subunit TrpB [candidate division CPR3 bacterium GW2011_GWF2_35_18]OGB63050.1 MAG: tryptophan synthase subunit beta [candidate division CPR3 bacterium GWF2_35_18]OGB63926.1 MAG: tryptophan synthase subunit beta [candidate division CPR3 bacterium RIFOXYA2_FULL_35_13]
MKNYNQPNKKGEFGLFGGRYVPQQLTTRLAEIEKAYLELRNNPSFQKELQFLYKNYVGRPSLLYKADRLTEYCGGAKIYLKREDLNHTGAHKLNNTVGQALLARKLGKKKLIAETGAGQHGVAVATVTALMGMQCDIYMGKRDIINQKMNVYRMKLLGAKVVEVSEGQSTLKDAIDVALKNFITEENSYYMIGSVVGPHPYPMIVRDFQKIVGNEVKSQIKKQEGILPDYLVACIGGGSNAMGLFYEFIKDKEVKLVGVEPAGLGEKTDRHGLALMRGKPGIIHGFKCRVLQNKSGEIGESYSAASGLDYPGVGPEPSFLVETKRLEVVGVTDSEAVKAFCDLSRLEGIIPALESAHAISYAMKLAQRLKKEQVIVVNLSGRGDKDVENVFENLII